MARTVIRCRYTGNYILTNHDAGAATEMFGGRIFCPYCSAEHVWSSNETTDGDSGGERHPAARRKPLVRQAI